MPFPGSKARNFFKTGACELLATETPEPTARGGIERNRNLADWEIFFGEVEVTGCLLVVCQSLSIFLTIRCFSVVCGCFFEFVVGTGSL